MPWRWLPAEALDSQVYTDKTDCYAFGVTFWEILTYGQILPFEGISSVKRIIKFLEEGNILRQPPNCTGGVL